mmetsp:Transcript_10737/g.40341  ORF Transcript_10737/g.40341 Transcript_10737/m.40341 type:complete len:129 (-) Transcript_10737:206-592(-)
MGGEDGAPSCAIVPFRAKSAVPRDRQGSFAALPVYTDYLMLTYCPAPTLAVCAAVCRRWRNFSEQEELWERLNLQRWGVKGSAFKTRPPAKTLYKCNAEHYRRLRRLYRHGEPAVYLGNFAATIRVAV